MSHTTICPKCHNIVTAPFPIECPLCGFSLEHLIGFPSPDTIKKRDKHTELLTKGSISLHGGEFNASFDYYGLLSLPDLVRYTVSYGHRSELPSVHGGHQNPIIVAYLPEIIGSGISQYNKHYGACSGVCIISPGSERWGHPYPVLDEWVQNQCSTKIGKCFLCDLPTPFGHTICAGCYEKVGSDWRTFLG